MCFSVNIKSESVRSYLILSSVISEGESGGPQDSLLWYSICNSVVTAFMSPEMRLCDIFIFSS